MAIFRCFFFGNDYRKKNRVTEKKQSGYRSKRAQKWFLSPEMERTPQIRPLYRKLGPSELYLIEKIDFVTKVEKSREFFQSLITPSKRKIAL